jgi:hypothetical protein
MKKHIIFTLLLLATIVSTADAQTWLRYRQKADSTWQTASEYNPFPVSLEKPTNLGYTWRDTTLTISTDAVQLSTAIDTVNLGFIYIENQSSNQLRVGRTSSVATRGTILYPTDGYTDSGDLFSNTTSVYLRAAASSTVYILYAYKEN